MEAVTVGPPQILASAEGKEAPSVLPGDGDSTLPSGICKRTFPVLLFVIPSPPCGDSCPAVLPSSSPTSLIRAEVTCGSFRDLGIEGFINNLEPVGHLGQG